MHAALGIVLGAWLLASTVAQCIPRDSGIKQRFDPLSLVPDWRLFAPTPVSFDYHLLARAVHEDGTTEQWREVGQPRRRLWWHGVFHPNRRGEKALFEACTGLASFMVKSADKQLEGCSSYLRITALAGAAVPGEGPFQFMVMRSMPNEGDGTGFEVFVRSPSYRRHMPVGERDAA